MPPVSNNSKMSDSRVGDIAAMKLAVADGRLVVFYPFWNNPVAFSQFKDENKKWLIEKWMISGHCSWQSQMPDCLYFTHFGKIHLHFQNLKMKI